MPRLLIVSNRPPVTVRAGPDGVSVERSSGGLATGMKGPHERLGGFCLKGGRLFCFQDERRLLALDAETGRVLWTYQAPGAHVAPEPPGGRFHPNYHAGVDRVILQTGGGQLLVLDSRTGKALFSARAKTARVLASNTKLFTSAAVLGRYGPSSTIATAVLGVLIVLLILVLPQRPGSHPAREEAGA